ncbi:TetR/AcrR family transcriptional regulator C-terminal domain-containing protein [Pseudonocardia yunnanensis]|uniref:TetR/AcrR family transcriptional regulator C-terminal domain-containing protein n=1 Tax=Pseudonocardia yunnanensis TaxID=58107 RepID=A0ABW4ERG8_9PSEU
MGERNIGRHTRAKRPPLSRDMVVAAAIALADEAGETGVSMRAIAARLGVQAMSLYNHVSSREDVLDGMVDSVFGEIDLPASTTDWREAMRDRAASVRAALQRHHWAVGLMDSRRRPGPATLRHHDAVLGALRAGGFSVAMAVHAFTVIDSYLYGFVLQELSLPFTGPVEFGEVAEGIARDLPADAYPNLTEVLTEYTRRPDYDYASEFDLGLSMILNALQPDEA